MNTSDEVIFIAIGDSLERGFEPFMIQPGELIAVKSVKTDLADGGTSSCSVSCTDGYFACCNAGNCFCYQQSRPPQDGCSSGGAGSISCSIDSPDDTGEGL